MQLSFSKLLRPLLVLLLLLPAGCAKSPSGGATSPVSGPQLLISVTFAAPINSDYYYYILFNVNNTPGPPGATKTGPVAVVTSADYVGNGFAAGAFTNYVEYTSKQPGGTNFGYYGITADLSTPIGPTQGQLIQATASGKTLMFQLPLAYLATSSYTADKITSLQINFVTTNFVPVSTGNISNPKYFDALYQSQAPTGYSYFNLIVRDANDTLMPGIYNNESPGSINGAPVSQYVNGVAQPIGTISYPDGTTTDSLLITGWSIQLTAGS